jgi:excisionase family DNA binding protein
LSTRESLFEGKSKVSEEKLNDDLKVFSKDEVAKLLTLSPMTVHRAIRGKKLGHYRIGSRVLISAQYLEAYLARCERTPRTKAVA